MECASDILLFAWDREKRHRLVIGEGISYSIGFCIFVFIACVFLPSRFLDKSQVSP